MKNTSYFLKKLLYFMYIPFFFFFLFFIIEKSSQDLKDVDYFFHIKAGEYIVKERVLPDKDIFSFTHADKKWINHEWLFQVFLYFCYTQLGLNNLGYVLASVFSLAFLFLFLSVLRLKDDWIFGAFLLILGLKISFTRFVIRPDNLSFLCVIIYLYTLCYEKKFFLYLVPLIQIIWTNVHGFFILGPLIFLFYILFNKRENKTFFYRRVKLIFILMLLSIFISPYSFNTIIYPLERCWSILRGKEYIIYESIQELKVPFNTPHFLTLILPFVVITSLTLLFFKRFNLFLFMNWLFFLFFSFNSMRNIYFLVAIGIFVFVDRFIYVKEFFLKHFIREKGLILLRVLLLLYISLIFKNTIKYISRSPLYYTYISSHNEIKLVPKYFTAYNKAVPLEMLEFIRDTPLPDRMFNNFNSGAYLIFHTFPKRKVFIDGRAEFYDKTFFSLYTKINIGDKEATIEAIDKYHLDGFIIAYTRDELTPLIRTVYDLGYKCVYFKGDGIIFVSPKYLKEDPYLQKYLVDFSREYIKVDLINEIKNYIPDLDSIYRKAYVLDMLGFYNNSINYLEEILKIDPRYDKVYYLLGKVYYKEKDYEKAFIYSRASLLINPKDNLSREILAKIYIKNGQEEAAKRILKRLRVDYEEFKRRVESE